MDFFDDSHARRFARLLEQREAQLSAVLAGSDLAELRAPAAGGEVTDTKDAASDESVAAVEAQMAEHAALELEQVLAARHRLAHGTFGLCVECGAPISLARLNALPFAAHCMACQAQQERDAPPQRQH